jgi:hypothetical protein
MSRKKYEYNCSAKSCFYSKFFSDFWHKKNPLKFVYVVHSLERAAFHLTKRECQDFAIQAQRNVLGTSRPMRKDATQNFMEKSRESANKDVTLAAQSTVFFS